MSEEEKKLQSEEIETKASEQTATAVQEAPAAAPAAPKKEKKKRTAGQKKKVRRLIIWLIVLGLLGGGGYWAYQKFFNKPEASQEALTDFVTYNSITSRVEGSGLTKAAKSSTVSIGTAGTMIEVFVEEGQQVYAGDPLFTIDSPAAEAVVESAKKKVKNVQNQISDLQKNLAGLNLAPTFSGKLLDTVRLSAGDQVGAGMRVATVVDDTNFILTQYFSYAYEKDLYKGQTMEVSLPAIMTSVTGTIKEIRYVSRITPEGSKLFCVDITVPNAGALSQGMTASASTQVNGESIYPYEAGSLEYSKVADLTTTVGGTVISANLYDYLDVKKGQVLLKLSPDESDNQMDELDLALDDALAELEEAEENLANCSCVAPIDGMIIGLSRRPGDEINANEQILTISDTNTIMINASVDERNIGYVKTGMPVTLDQWGTMAFGTIDSISLNSTINNGVASYPIVIAADNYEGTLQLNSYISYSLEASRSDNCLVVPLQCVNSVLLADETEADVVFIRAEEAPENAVELMPDSGVTVPEGFYAVKVEIGLSDTYNVEIKSGLEEGMEVFTQLVSSEVWY